MALLGSSVSNMEALWNAELSESVLLCEQVSYLSREECKPKLGDQPQIDQTPFQTSPPEPIIP